MKLTRTALLAVVLILALSLSAFALGTTRVGSRSAYNPAVNTGTGYLYTANSLASGTLFAYQSTGTVTGNMLSITANGLTSGNFILLTADNDTMNGGYYLKLLGGADHATTVYTVGENGAVTAVGGDFQINSTGTTKKFKVAAASGNTEVVGTLAVTGTSTLTGVSTLTAPKLGTIIANTDGTETLTASQTGAIVTCSKSDGVTTITLPDPAAGTVGCVYFIYQTADQNVDIVPTTANGNSIVADNVATSDKVSLDTSGHKIGAGAMVVGISATKWLITPLSVTCPLTVEAAD